MSNETGAMSNAATEQNEFDFYLQFDWPEHIETALRRLIWISLVETAEPGMNNVAHTSLLRWMIATHPDSPPEVLAFLAAVGDARLLERIAENPNTSPATLAHLATHPSSQVRIAVADNAHTPINVLALLAQGDDLNVKYCMAENPALPAKMLQGLQADANPYVSWRAGQTLMRRNPSSTVQKLPVTRMGTEKAQRDDDQWRQAM
jgi:hypothetical protein